jgi:hypothetical protein
MWFIVLGGRFSKGGINAYLCVIGFAFLCFGFVVEFAVLLDLLVVFEVVDFRFEDLTRWT